MRETPHARASPPLCAVALSSALLASCSASGGRRLAVRSAGVLFTGGRKLIQPGTMLSAASVYGALVWTAGHLPEGVSGVGAAG